MSRFYSIELNGENIPVLGMINWEIFVFSMTTFRWSCKSDRRCHVTDMWMKATSDNSCNNTPNPSFQKIRPWKRETPLWLLTPSLTRLDLTKCLKPHALWDHLYQHKQSKTKIDVKKISMLSPSGWNLWFLAPWKRYTILRSIRSIRKLQHLKEFCKLSLLSKQGVIYILCKTNVFWLGYEKIYPR